VKKRVSLQGNLEHGQRRNSTPLKELVGLKEKKERSVPAGLWKDLSAFSEMELSIEGNSGGLKGGDNSNTKGRGKRGGMICRSVFAL